MEIKIFFGPRTHDTIEPAMLIILVVDCKVAILSFYELLNRDHSSMNYFTETTVRLILGLGFRVFGSVPDKNRSGPGFRLFKNVSNEYLDPLRFGFGSGTTGSGSVRSFDKSNHIQSEKMGTQCFGLKNIQTCTRNQLGTKRFG